ncbi:MAG: lysophospholipid acyltransferase family protein [Actinomycetales bacterium]
MRPVRPMAERRGPWWRFIIAVLRRPLFAMAQYEWQGADRLPTTGGVIVCPNHISYVDPLMIALFLHEHGRLVRFLAKSSLWKVPLLKQVLNGTGQIPVVRNSAEASGAFADALRSLDEGHAVVVYPEATVTRDPRLWPMAGKTGAARLALTTGCPVLPVAQWGAQDVLEPYGKRLHVRPKHRVVVRVGDPVELDDLRNRPLDAAVVREATGRILDAITAMLAEIRGEQPPAERFDPRALGVAETGNPEK